MSYALIFLFYAAVIDLHSLSYGRNCEQENRTKNDE